MNKQKEIISMILAGGKGTRLGVLTEELAKPAVSYGGKYKLIDFPLSNCVNSGIDTVGVVTQYKANAISDYIGNGKDWNLESFSEGGVSFLHPHNSGDFDNVYKGTANAIYQNEEYIEKYSPKYVLILSGDHIYKMNYKKMLEHHKSTGAKATIAVIKVPMEEASRFGILNTDNNTVIESFEEKPKNPKSNLASMGIYIFNWETLKKYLKEDEDNKESSNDFGKDVIPMMLRAKEKMVAFEFEGYWKDVGTIESLWESNMDLLNRECQLRDNEAWKISCKDAGYDKCKIGFDALVYHSILGENCEVNGIVEKSILSKNVKVERGAIIKNSVILENVEVKCSSIIENAIIGENTIVEFGTIICKKDGIAVIGANRTVNEYSMNDKGIID